MRYITLTLTLTTLLCTTTIGQNMNWTLVNTGTTKNIRDISFINRDTGFIAGDDGLFKMTTNGGTTWTDLTLPPTGQGTGNNNNIKVAQFYNNSGLVGGVLFYDKFTHVNRNYDIFNQPWIQECGGPPFAQYDSVCSVNNFHRNAVFTEYTAGGNCLEGGGTIGWFGGFCFTFDSLMSDTSFNGWMDITSNVNDIAITVGENGYYAVKPGGFTWNLMNSGSGFDYLSVDWSDTSTVYAANNSTWYWLEKSTDGGNTWEFDSIAGPTFWYPVPAEVDFTDNDWGVIACSANINYGVIITKMGNNIDYFNADTPLTSTYVLDSTYAFAGGLGGLLYKYEKTGGMGINEPLEQVQFNIFPNPQNVLNNELNLFSENVVRELVVYDLTGKVLFDQNINQQGNISVRTNVQNAGTYLVRIITDKGVGTKKYILNE